MAARKKKRKPRRISVLILMGSQSDWPTMKKAADMLKSLGVSHRALITSAHRTPDRMRSVARNAPLVGAKVIIAGAGGAAHLPGMVSAYQCGLPIIGVPVASRSEASGIKDDAAVLSILAMPRGVPVATVAPGEWGAVNAALLAAAIVGLSNRRVQANLLAHRALQTRCVPRVPKDPPQEKPAAANTKR